jgi:hypothetical protein
MALAIFNSIIDQLRILGLLRGGEDERWVGGGILWLVLGNGCYMLAQISRKEQIELTVEVAGITDHGLGKC